MRNRIYVDDNVKIRIPIATSEMPIAESFLNAPFIAVKK